MSRPGNCVFQLIGHACTSIPTDCTNEVSLVTKGSENILVLSHSLESAKLLPKPRLNLCPFVSDDAEDYGITYASARQDQVFAEDAFLRCSQTKNSRARLLIENVRDELHPITTPIIERMREHQQLAFRVHRSALRALRQPRVANRHGAIVRPNLIEARGADDFTGLLHGRDPRATLADNHEGQLFPRCLAGQRRLDVIDHRGRRRGNNRDRRFPKLAVARRGDERFFVRRRQRFEAYVLTFEYDWRDFHHSSLSLLRFVPFQVATAEHAGEIFAQEKPSLDQVHCTLGVQTQILRFRLVAFLQRRARIAALLAIAFRLSQRQVRADETDASPWRAGFWITQVPAGVRGDRHGEFRQSDSRDFISIRVYLRHKDWIRIADRWRLFADHSL